MYGSVQLTVTDFANNDALFELLNNLDNVFKEFKSHEEIENEHIMLKLKQKLKVSPLLLKTIAASSHSHATAGSGHS